LLPPTPISVCSKVLQLIIPEILESDFLFRYRENSIADFVLASIYSIKYIMNTWGNFGIWKVTRTSLRASCFGAWEKFGEIPDMKCSAGYDKGDLMH